MSKATHVIIGLVCQPPITPAVDLSAGSVLVLGVARGDDEAIRQVSEWTPDSGFSALLAVKKMARGHWLNAYSCGLMRWHMLEIIVSTDAYRPLVGQLESEMENSEL